MPFVQPFIPTEAPRSSFRFFTKNSENVTSISPPGQSRSLFPFTGNYNFSILCFTKFWPHFPDLGAEFEPSNRIPFAFYLPNTLWDATDMFSLLFVVLCIRLTRSAPSFGVSAVKGGVVFYRVILSSNFGSATSLLLRFSFYNIHTVYNPKPERLVSIF